MLQQIISRASFSAQTNDRGSNPFLEMHSVANGGTQATTMPVAGTFRNLRVYAEAAFGAGSNVVSLYVNGSISTLTGTINSGTQTFTDTDSVAVSAGDTVEMRFNMTGAPTHVLRIALEFEATAANTSVYGFGGATSAPNNTYDGVMFGGGVQGWVVSAVPAEADDLVGTDGVYTGMRIRAGSAPGGGNTRTFVIYRNGVAQNGSGGTPDTRITLGAADTTGSSTFTLAVFEGDLVRVGHSVTGAPTTFNIPVTGSVSFVSSYANRWNMGATGNNGASGAATVYAHPFVNRIAIAFSGTEANFLQRSGPTSFYLSGLRVLQNAAPGTAEAWSYTLRLGGADTAQTVTISDAAVEGASVGAAVQITDGVDLSMEVTPTGTPNAAAYTKWVFVGSETPPEDTPTGGGCTPTCGPGGAPPGQGPGDPPVDTPRVIPPGGDTPTYTPCSTGGDPATAADPSNPQSLTDAVTPLAHLQLTLRNGTVLRYGDQAFTSGNGQAVQARVRQWGPIVDSISDRECQIQSQRTTVRLSDADRAIRGILSSAATKNIYGIDAIHYIESAANAALNVQPNVLSRGIVTNWRGITDLEIELDIADPMGVRYSPVSLDRLFPVRRIRAEIFPTAPEHVVGRVVPVIYGELSDDFTWSFTPSRIPAGIIPVIHVGMAGDIPGLENFEPMWQAWVICGHAIEGIQSWFASNNDATNPGSVRMELGTEGVDFLIPGYAGFAARHPTTYIDLTGTDGVTERFTMMFSRGPRGDAAVEGGAPITLNGCFIEDVGNGTGDVITNTISQIQHFICEWHFGAYKTGLWAGVPLYPDGTPKISIPSFNRARTIVNARNGGYFGAWYIGVEQTMREWLAKLCLGADLRPGTVAGRMMVSTMDETDTAAVSYTEAHIEESLFDISPGGEDFFNIQPFNAALEPATGRYAWPMTTRRDEDSITDHGERPADPIEIMTTQLLANAQDVTDRRLQLAAQPRAMPAFHVDLRGLEPAPGDLINVTHYAGIGSAGWTNRTLRLMRRTTDLNEFLCTMEPEDVDDIINP